MRDALQIPRCRAWALAFAVLAASSRDLAANESQTALATAYVRQSLITQVQTQAVALAAGGVAYERDAIAAATAKWAGWRRDKIRGDLEHALGSAARERFGAFAREFLAADAAGDKEYLAQLSREIGLSPLPADYAALAAQVIDTRLRADVDAAAGFLGRLQVWINRDRTEDGALPLEDWLGVTAPVAPPGSPPPPLPGVDPLAAAEPVATPVAPTVDEETALGAFAGGHKTRRQQQVEIARSHMQQTADERRQWEEEWGRKKSDAGNAEAEARRRQAERLAQNEKDALEQSKNTWAARLKTIAASTVGVAVGAFTTPIATRSAEKATQALFGE